MGSLYDYYKNIFEEFGDPRIKDWPFMDRPGLALLIPLVYVILVAKVGPYYMKNRQPFNLDKIIHYYNIFQIIICTTIFTKVLFIVLEENKSIFGCVPCDYSDNPNALLFAKWLWYSMLLKYFDLIETFFFILRKKFNQVSVLHIYHHSSTAYFFWLALKFTAGGMVVFPLMFNTFIHILMYTYYYLSSIASSLGPRWQKILRFWKPKLTILQMIQFTFVIIHALHVFKSDCDVSNFIGYVGLPDVFLIFYLFYDFYKQAYVKKDKSKI